MMPSFVRRNIWSAVVLPLGVADLPKVVVGVNTRWPRHSNGFEPMKNFLSALAFAGLIAAQFLSVVFANARAREGPSPGTRGRIARNPACGSLARSSRKGFASALRYPCTSIGGPAVKVAARVFDRVKPS